MAEVVAVLRDRERWQEIVDRAYNEVALNPRFTFKAMVLQFDEVVDRRSPSLLRRSKPAYSEATFSSTMLGVRGAVHTPRGTVAAMGRRLKHYMEYRLAARLSRFVRLFLGSREREKLKRAYFGAIDGFIATGAMLQRYRSAFRGMRFLLRGKAATAFLRLPISLGQKFLLLQEIAALRQIDRLACDEKLFSLTIDLDPKQHLLLIQGWMSDEKAGQSAARPAWEHVIADAEGNAALRVRWIMQDRWRLALHPDLPDAFDFPSLSASFAVAPEFATTVLRRSFPSVSPELTSQIVASDSFGRGLRE
ncbi:MAG: hypothetical protein HC807_03025 [Gammaproteobacteria bacterium]|nr:hypothetical protein [Gammaproteobacteria bacterium]